MRGARIATSLFVAWASVGGLRARPARAAGHLSVALEYEAPSESSDCPDEAGFRSGVEHQLGYDPFAAGAAAPAVDRRLAVQIGRSEGAFDARIRWGDQSGDWTGERRLSSLRSECREIAASATFAVAVQIQLLASLAPPAATAPPEPPPPRAPEVIVTAPAEPARPPPVPPPAGPVTLWIGVGPALGLGVGPRPMALGRLVLAARLARFSFELGADAAWPSNRREPDGSGFSLRRFASTAAACGHLSPLGACVIGTLGILEARGFGVDAPGTPTGLLSQVGLRLAARHDFGRRIFAGAHVDGIVTLSRWTITVNEATAWVTPRAGALIGADFGARFF